MRLNKETSNEVFENFISCRSQFCCLCVYTKLEILILGFHIFYQRMKVSPEARRLAKYKEKKKISIATLQLDVTFCTPILCAP